MSMVSSKKEGSGTGGRFISTTWAFQAVSVMAPLFCAMEVLISVVSWSGWSDWGVSVGGFSLMGSVEMLVSSGYLVVVAWSGGGIGCTSFLSVFPDLSCSHGGRGFG